MISLWFPCLYVRLKTFMASFLKILKTSFSFLHQSITSKRENISPDYPLTLLEGLTTISHFCLLEQPNQNKKVNHFFPEFETVFIYCFVFIGVTSVSKKKCMYVIQTYTQTLMQMNTYANNEVYANIRANVCM